MNFSAKDVVLLTGSADKAVAQQIEASGASLRALPRDSGPANFADFRHAISALTRAAQWPKARRATLQCTPATWQA